MLVTDLFSLSLTMVSMFAAVVLIVALCAQEVYGHIKAARILLIGYFTAFIGVDLILALRLSLPFNGAMTVIALKFMYSFMLFAMAIIGYFATIIYVKPASSEWRAINTEIFRSKIYLPFTLFLAIIVGVLILVWFVPLSVELGYFPSSIGRYVPVYSPLHIMAFHLVLIIFIAYPFPIFLLASYATENAVVSRYLRMFAVSIVGLAISNYLQRFFLTSCSAAAADVIQIPCLIAQAYVFRKITSLQRFYYVDLKEYVKHLLPHTS